MTVNGVVIDRAVNNTPATTAQRNSNAAPNIERFEAYLDGVAPTAVNSYKAPNPIDVNDYMDPAPPAIPAHDRGQH